MAYDRKLRIGSDGTVAYGINAATNFAFDLTAAMTLADTNVGDLDRIIGDTPGFPLPKPLIEKTHIFFNRDTHVTKFDVFHTHTTSMRLKLSYSTDSTDGLNNTWTNSVVFPASQFGIVAWQATHTYSPGDQFQNGGIYYQVTTGYTSGAAFAAPGADGTNTTTFTTLNYTPLIPPNTIVSLNCNSINTCVGVKVEFYGTELPYGLIRIFNVYGEHLLPKFQFMSTGDVELTGLTPLAFSGSFSKYAQNAEILEFKIKNTDGALAKIFNVFIRTVGAVSGSIADFLTIIDKASLAVGPGTVSVSAGSKAVTGVGTNFRDSEAYTDIGRVILVNGQLLTIASVTSTTSCTVAQNASGAFSGVYSQAPEGAGNTVTTGSIANNSNANMILSLFCPANSNVLLGQSEYSIDVTAN